MTNIDEYVDWKQWNIQQFGKPTVTENAYCMAELGPYTNKKKLRILELGYGNGGVLGWLRSNGHDVVGVETNPNLVSAARNNNFTAEISINDIIDQFADQPFDLVLAFDVFEHIKTDDILVLMQDIKKLLSCDGKLILRFPNGDSPFGRIYQYGDVTHQSVIGSIKVKWLALKTGFLVDVIKEPATPLNGEIFRRKVARLIAKCLRIIIDKFISYAYFMGGAKVFSANLVVVLSLDKAMPKEPLDSRAVK